MKFKSLHVPLSFDPNFLMGRPEPCVLFAQNFVHPHLDEYVDEVTPLSTVVYRYFVLSIALLGRKKIELIVLVKI